MAANRQSINKVALRLCDLIDIGGTILPAHQKVADHLRKLADNGGSYSRQFENHEERVLNRHLNLYKNKLSKARTEAERLRWQSKVIEQQAKLRAYKTGDADLDLDGL